MCFPSTVNISSSAAVRRYLGDSVEGTIIPLFFLYKPQSVSTGGGFYLDCKAWKPANDTQDVFGVEKETELCLYLGDHIVVQDQKQTSYECWSVWIKIRAKKVEGEDR